MTTAMDYEELVASMAAIVRELFPPKRVEEFFGRGAHLVLDGDIPALVGRDVFRAYVLRGDMRWFACFPMDAIRYGLSDGNVADFVDLVEAEMLELSHLARVPIW